MPFPKRSVKVAVPQAEPAWLDLHAGVTKTLEIIKEAASNGAELIAFSECWIPGYPNFLWGNAFKDNIDLVRRYYENSMTVDGPEFQRIRSAAVETKTYVMFGFSEKLEASLFMAQTLISPTGDILLHRHKIKPTHVERTLFGEGSGDSINNVAKTPIGNIGALQCWEHLQPLLKFHTYAQHEHFHIAAWPTNNKYCGWEPWSFSNDAAVIASRMYAMESGAYTIVATQCQTKRTLEFFSGGQEGSSSSHMAQIGGGFTAIYAPDGKKLTEDVAPDWEGILYADCDFEKIRFAKAVADPVGHYSRPDLFQLVVDTERKEHIVKRSGNISGNPNMLHKFEAFALASTGDGSTPGMAESEDDAEIVQA